MKIDLQKIKIKDLVEGYKRDEESGEIIGCGGKLNIRPKYQREYVYKDKQRDEVVRTIFKGFPLNSIYWVQNGEEFEVLDGQQRTISVCDYVAGDFSVDGVYFHNLPQDRKAKFLEYALLVYVCEGSESEKLEWFRVINIAGEKLSEQELRNAVYVSAWLSDAKRRFSKRGSLAEKKGGWFLKGESLRQEFLESAIAWIAGKREDKSICKYMAKNAKESKNADELWGYFCKVIDWVEMKFPKYRKEMKGLEWGFFYNTYGELALDAGELEARVSALMKDSEVGRKSGIYAYVLSGDERFLNLRAFDENVKAQTYERQGGICANGGVEGGGQGLKRVKCPHKNEVLEIGQMEADHIIPWSKGGKTEAANCQMLCRECNRAKSDK